jgi:salicylate hydroxylase
MAMLIGQDVAVVGAGIGGLAAALALALRGARVRVFERAEAVREIGAGLQISPNGCAVLAGLGVLDALAARSVRGRAVRLRPKDGGRDVARLDLSALDGAGPWLFVHRADLVAVLADAARAAGVELHLGQAVSDLRDAARPVLRLADGTEEAAGLVVAADGVRSGLRGAVEDAPAPAFTGQTAWRALVPLAAPAPPEVSVVMGPGRHLVAYPLRDSRVMNVVAVMEQANWAPEGWSHPDDPANLRATFADFPYDVRALLDKVQDVHRWGLFRHPVARRWQRGRLALLGDAAHPTLPFLAQGACMALEDAWVLADRLAGADTPEAGLAAYAAARRDRCVRIVAAADLNARIYHLRRGLARGAVHAGLRIGGRIAPGAALRRFDWLYRRDVTAREGQGRPAGSGA